MPSDCGVTIMIYVIEMSLKPSQQSVFRWAHILGATGTTGDDINQIRALTVYFSHASKCFIITV